MLLIVDTYIPHAILLCYNIFTFMLASTCAVHILPAGVIVIELDIVIVEVISVNTDTDESIVLVAMEVELLTAQLFPVIHSTQ